MEKAEKNKRIGKIFLILFICLADIGWAAAVLYAWKRNGTILSVKTASADIPGIFVQNIIVSAVPIFLFIICLAVLKKDFFARMCFKVNSRKQKIAVASLAAVLVILALYCLVTKTDKIMVLYNLLYYTVFSYAGWGELTFRYLFSIVSSQMLGLIVMGCLFQYLKEKSGTIWVPVLVHAILDFSVVLGY